MNNIRPFPDNHTGKGRLHLFPCSKNCTKQEQLLAFMSGNPVKGIKKGCMPFSGVFNFEEIGI
ncbi:hypothetical protein SRABI96_02734 [Peribacillus sp. Bi96]|nr:hypothetical protein SRABI96_02734 [Peribacillus sp. Bi96]